MLTSIYTNGMKKYGFKSLTLLLLTPLLLTSCDNSANKITVPLNIDYYLNKNEEVELFPTPLTGDQVTMMIESKQDFILYFHSRQCALCSQVNNFFDTFLKNHPIQVYSFSAQSSDIVYISDLYPQYFDATPKVMFFKNGTNVLTLSTSRYSSYRSFESALMEFAMTNKIYTTTTLQGVEKFIEYKEEFLIFFLNDEKIIQNSDWPYFSFYRQEVFPYLEKSQLNSLILDQNMLDNEAKTYLYNTYGLSNDISTWAIYINELEQKSTRYNYQVDQDKQLLKELLLSFDD